MSTHDSKEEDNDKSQILKRIKKYITNVVQDDYDCDVFDNQLFNDIIIKYKEEHDVQYLIEIQKWNNECMQQIYRISNFLHEYGLDYNNSNQEQFIMNCCIKLYKLFFYIQIIGATLDCFQQDIQKLTKKEISEVTFNDLTGVNTNNGDEQMTVWRTLYDDKNDLDFVVDEMQRIFTPSMCEKSLQNMCQLQSEFIASYYNGNYLLFSKLISFYMSQYIGIETCTSQIIDCFLDEVITGTILVLNDKKTFLKNVFKSIKENQPEPIEIENKFEQIVAVIIVEICQIDDETQDFEMIKSKLDISLSQIHYPLSENL
eukprot:24953_1